MPLLGPYGVLSGALPVSSTKGYAHEGGVVLLVGFFAECGIRADDFMLILYGFTGLNTLN